MLTQHEQRILAQVRVLQSDGRDCVTINDFANCCGGDHNKVCYHGSVRNALVSLVTKGLLVRETQGHYRISRLVQPQAHDQSQSNCRKCGIQLTESNWRRGHLCVDCEKQAARQRYRDPIKARENWRRWWERNKSEYKKKHREAIRQLRIEVLRHYSPDLKCLICGNSDMDVLTLDHIYGGGGRHLRALNGSQNLCRWIKRNNFPPIFRVLCMNCNWKQRASKAIRQSAG